MVKLKNWCNKFELVSACEGLDYPIYNADSVICKYNTIPASFVWLGV